MGWENPCRSCTALCCRKGMALRLTEVEYQFLVRGGSDICVVVKPQPFYQILETDSEQYEGKVVEPGKGFFILLEDCG